MIRNTETHAEPTTPLLGRGMPHTGLNFITHLILFSLVLPGKAHSYVHDLIGILVHIRDDFLATPWNKNAHGKKLHAPYYCRLALLSDNGVIRV